MKPSECRAVVDSVALRVRPKPALTDPLHLVLWENICYLIDDDRRAAVFAAFEARVGLDAAAIARASQTTLLDLARKGGMRPDTRVERWRMIAKIVKESADGDLAGALKALPLAKARALVKSFPAIGDPGADKVMLFAGIEVRPALDSNGVRAMLRLGLAPERASYGATYKEATATLREHGRPTRAWFMKAYAALRAHGQALCKRAAPLCTACPLDAACGHVRIKGQY